MLHALELGRSMIRMVKMTCIFADTAKLFASLAHFVLAQKSK